MRNGMIKYQILNNMNRIEWATLVTVATLATVTLKVEGQRSCSTDGCLHGNGGLPCQSCQPECYGSTCSYTCHGRCDTDGCNRQTGQCFRCRPGMYGRDCDQTCPLKCANSVIGGNAYCDRDTGACSEACRPGWSGSHCNESCPLNCKHQTCNKQTKQCIAGCETGWTGDYCNTTCDNCLMGRCNDKGYCLLGCKAGFFGQNCDRGCQHCWTTGCDRGSGICEQCHPGYHGSHCAETCPETCYKGWEGYRNCDRHTKACLEGCEPGWHGSHCNTPCSTSCTAARCYRRDGSCVDGCVPGFYGKHCHKRCSHENCKNNTCDYHGHCTECKDGWFGEDCRRLCPALCESFLRDTGHCSRCSDGYHGPDCDDKCSDTCLHHTCDRDGNCFECRDLTYGTRCQYPCSENCERCDQTTGACTRCRGGHFLEDGRCTPTVSEHYTSSRADSVKHTRFQLKHFSAFSKHLSVHAL
ncbi:multiple epidermal growth factor-like domains protein 10 isoform X1 [Haliotis rubra]|uniref:multiple epidermal growth factor-like domains protein 10 isoform X1 n=3 Tax=Haliotis rubra TaxID=36100 RepID=UPI001EE5EFBB|nr:multiple epidermal growth factor-like domains protein 10 isoform X1 [Haliotis rubra]